MHTPSINLPIKSVYTVLICIRPNDNNKIAVNTKIKFLLLKIWSRYLKKNAPNTPPKGIVPINRPCASGNENAIWYYFAKTYIGMVDTCVRPYPKMRAHIAIVNPIMIIKPKFLYRTCLSLFFGTN